MSRWKNGWVTAGWVGESIDRWMGRQKVSQPTILFYSKNRIILWFFFRQNLILMCVICRLAGFLPIHPSVHRHTYSSTKRTLGKQRYKKILSRCHFPPNQFIGLTSHKKTLQEPLDFLFFFYFLSFFFLDAWLHFFYILRRINKARVLSKNGKEELPGRSF